MFKHSDNVDYTAQRMKAISSLTSLYIINILPFAYRYIVKEPNLACMWQDFEC